MATKRLPRYIQRLADGTFRVLFTLSGVRMPPGKYATAMEAMAAKMLWESDQLNKQTAGKGI